MGTSYSPNGDWPDWLEEARETLRTLLPNHRALLDQLRPVAHPQMPMVTMMVDNKLRVFYHPKVVETFTPPELAAVLYHEVEHFRREHHARAVEMRDRIEKYAKSYWPRRGYRGERGPITITASPLTPAGDRGYRTVPDLSKPEVMRWVKLTENVSMDAEINCSPVFRGGPLTLPAGAITPEGYGKPAGHVWERYFWSFWEQLQEEEQAAKEFAEDEAAYRKVTGEDQDEQDPEDGPGEPGGEEHGKGKGTSDGEPGDEDASSDEEGGQEADPGDGEHDEPGKGEEKAGYAVDSGCDDEADHVGSPGSPDGREDGDEQEASPSGEAGGERDDVADGSGSPDSPDDREGGDAESGEDEDDGGWSCSASEDVDGEELDRVAEEQGVDGAPQDLVDAILDNAAEGVEERVGASNRGVKDGATVRHAKWRRESRRDYLQVLSKYVGRALTTQGQTNYTWTKPSRRQDAYAGSSGYIPPKLVAQLPTICVVIDSSGSITDDMISRAWAEARSVARTFGPTMCIIGDMQPRKVITIDGRGNADFGPGRGGTDMPALFDYALKHFPGIECLICYTDGETPWPERKLKVPLIVALIGDYAECMDRQADWRDRLAKRRDYLIPSWADVLVAAPPLIGDGAIVITDI